MKYTLSDIAKLVTLLVVLCFSSLTNAQTAKLDSLKNLLRSAARTDTVYLEILATTAFEMRKHNLDSSSIYFDKLRNLSERLKSVRYQIKSANGAGVTYGMKDDYPQAIAKFNEALSLSLTNGFPLYAGDSYNGLGIVYKRLGDYPTSLAYYSKSLKLYDSLKEELSLAASFQNMGVLSDLMRDSSSAMDYYQKALSIYKNKNDERGLARINSNIGMLYLGTGDYQRAIEVFEKNSKFYADHDMGREATRSLFNLGYSYYQAGELAKAETVVTSAIAHASHEHSPEMLVNGFFTLTKVKAGRGQYSAAFRTGRDAIRIADSTGSHSLRSKAYEALSHAYEKSGDTNSALKYYKLYKQYEDSVFNENKSLAYEQQKVLMDVQAKDQQIRDQALRLAGLDKEIALENRWNVMLGIAMALLLVTGLLYYQKNRARIKYLRDLESQNSLIKDQHDEIETINNHLHEQILLRKETDDTINYFATSLFGKNTVDEVLWDVAKNCIARLGLVDCVIYLVDEARGVLVQKAAYGSKNPEDFHIHDPIEIPLGRGIVGSVAKNGVAEIVNDTSSDARYIVDDAARSSELAVPLIIQNTVIGVIDTEHPNKDFFTQHHLEALKTIASICSSKIAQAQADQEAQKAREAQLEADQIRQLDAMKSQLFANISHEFRTPLNLILAPLQKGELVNAAEMEMMARNAKRLLRLVNQLLDLAKIEVGLLKPDLSYINVFGFVADIANAFTLISGAKNIRYHIDIPESDHVAYTDPDKLEKIVYNLLSNAFKFTPHDGSVVIRAFISDNRRLHIVITDNGIGIDRSLHDKVFSRFFQADGTITRSYEGSGIGLALTKELVDLLQGRIQLDSDTGAGCTFSVDLPLLDGPSNGLVKAKESETRYYPEGEHDRPSPDVVFDENPALPILLMVEDNAELREYVRVRLALKYNVLLAQNGEQGLTIARQRIPDLIISDIMMPLMDGVTLTKCLRDDERTSHIPIILLTARSDGETKIKGFETGAEQYLVKPFEMNELTARIQSLLSQQERLRKKYSSQVSLEPSNVVINNRDAQFLEKVINVVEANMSNESFTVEQLQTEIGMSRMQLHRKLKALTNQSASDFIRTTKLKRAAQILKQPGIQIAEAAYLSGFNHMSYFSKCFKEQFGVLPSEFAKSTADT